MYILRLEHYIFTHKFDKNKPRYEVQTYCHYVTNISYICQIYSNLTFALKARINTSSVFLQFCVCNAYRFAFFFNSENPSAISLLRIIAIYR